MSRSFGLPTRSSGRLPGGVLSLDYLKFLQLSVNADLSDLGILDAAVLEHAMTAVRSGLMRAEHPAMTFFLMAVGSGSPIISTRRHAVSVLGIRNSGVRFNLGRKTKCCDMRQNLRHPMFMS